MDKRFNLYSLKVIFNLCSVVYSVNVKFGGNTESCVPYVSEYTDCTEENKCSGCSKCECNAVGKWVCSEFHDCPDPTEVDLEKDGLLMEKDLDHAFKDLENELMVQRQTELENQRAVKGIKGHGVPEPASHEVKPSSTKNEFILDEQIVNLSDEIVSLIANDNAKYRTKEKPTYKYTEYGGFRYKRATSIDKEKSKTLNKGNGTVKFHNTLDEVNEDTLKNDTASGTISVQKVAALPQVSRRTGLLVNSTSSVQIGNEDTHRNDNTVDTPTIHDDKEDLLVHSKLHHVVGNYSHETKDKELSKILVNELKGGTSELIGEKGTPVISNITFHPENDTLTAMAFIAGNLLNKLWNMEKYASKDQIDTEDLKHEKISDLVELFKEPLNKRQEMFLKNALDKLSTVVNNHENVEDISLCKNIYFKDIKKQLKEFNDSDMDCATDKLINKTTPSPGTAEALNKITGVLNLISKYEIIQESLRSSNVKPINEVTDADKILSDDEKISLNLYGKTLETITNLLVPKAKTKKVIDSLHSGKKFSTRIDMNKKIPYFKIGNLNVTLKDKIIMDYLEHIQSNPECLLKNQKLVTPPSIEGDILLNLSEFFKIKSLSDLVRLVETEKPPTVSVFRSYDDLTAIKSEEETTTETLKKTRSEKLTDTKENLKKHLKSVFNDLTELKKTEGKGIHNDLQITDALPCLEKLFNDNIEVLETYNMDEWSKMSKTSVNQKNIPVSSVDVRIKEMFSNLRNELKIDQTRATNTNNGQRPKSAVVWERVVKNAAEKINHKTRRNMGTTSKTINEIESMLQKFEPLGSNTRYALFQEVPPSERLVVLKTLLADTLRYLKALDTINSSLLDITTNNKQQQQDKMTLIYKFIENSVVNLELTESVVNNLGRKNYFNKNNYNILPRKQTRTRPMREFEFATEKPKAYTSKLTRYNVVNQDKYIQAAKLNIDQIDSDKDEQSTKLTKDQVINQLIKNRIMLYIQTKEATGQTKNNWNFNIAEQILTHLEIGNFKLARELYKIFASRNKNTPKTNKYVTKNSDIIKPKIQYPFRRKAVQVEPLIDFQDSKYVQAYQDNFMQQLQNLRKLA